MDVYTRPQKYREQVLHIIRQLFLPFLIDDIIQLDIATRWNKTVLINLVCKHLGHELLFQFH